ncbi:hypothetical protein CCYA_CCYA03G0843 [Cyanidiococcus yangmingshanensis]|nr:hypothetical protein CCYA_CCYA03G0843 [Cyanidiococcus yangmingshanensis]
MVTTSHKKWESSSANEREVVDDTAAASTDYFSLDAFVQNVKEVCEFFEVSIEATLVRTTILTPSMTLIRRLHREALLDFSQPRTLVPHETALRAEPSEFVPIPAVYAVLDGPSWRYGEPDYEERSLAEFAAGQEEIKRVPLEPHERRLFPYADYVLQRGSVRLPVRSAPLRPADEKRMRRNKVSVQYMGITSNVALVVRHHLSHFGSSVCQFVRVCAFRSMDQATMEALRQAWMKEIGYVPRGNRTEDAKEAAFVQQWQAAHDWLLGLELGDAKMHPRQASTLINTQSANGEPNSKDDEPQSIGEGAPDHSRSSSFANTKPTRREQTPISYPSETEASGSGDGERDPRVVSPFRTEAGFSAVSTPETTLPMDTVHVEQVLSEIRPLLQKDGGDVRVLNVDPAEATVTLQFMGACASCPALEDTVRFGVETVLRARFGENQIRKIILVSNDESPVVKQEERRLVDACEAMLDDLRPLLFSRGAVVELERVHQRVLYLRYEGPEAMLAEIRNTLKERVPDLERVEALAFD